MYAKGSEKIVGTLILNTPCSAVIQKQSTFFANSLSSVLTDILFN